MIHSARLIVTPVANIVFCCFVLLDLKNGDGWTDGQHVRKQRSLPAVTLGWPSGSKTFMGIGGRWEELSKKIQLNREKREHPVCCCRLRKKNQNPATKKSNNNATTRNTKTMGTEIKSLSAKL